MNKVLVELYIPVTGKSYDLKIPRTLSVAKATELIVSFFDSTIEGAYLPDEQVSLCDMTTGKIYNVNSSVDSLHLKNGSKLMLI